MCARRSFLCVFQIKSIKIFASERSCKLKSMQNCDHLSIADKDNLILKTFPKEIDNDKNVVQKLLHFSDAKSVSRIYL